MFVFVTSSSGIHVTFFVTFTLIKSAASSRLSFYPPR